ncbi:hypothetical protein HS088_TW11G00793 [Tripterygium wilfordii]|uniref:KIB1-4 beta-propeller domain-containing protein n=1 Tax=Tripterygium wilfordii TaxID=458696 RepID=A0A7J7D3S2_TRIWF|nr:hypothetical protein HS088_TW11G00793 [Tripterygium wilfordii]
MAIIASAWIPAFCRPGDESWTILPRIDGLVEDIWYFNDKFYFITDHGDLVTGDFSDIGVPKENVIISKNDEEPLRGSRWVVDTSLSLCATNFSWFTKS